MEPTAGRREFLQSLAMAGGVVGSISATTEARAQETVAPSSPGTMTRRFRDLVRKGDPFENVAVYDILTARMAELLGFPSLYLGSTASSEFHGLPDWGILSLSEQVEFFGRIAQSVSIPAIADIDANSDVLVFYRAVQALNRAGVAAIHFGDAIQHGPTQIGVISQAAMIDRIRAARDASSDLVTTVRCQGLSIEGEPRTVERAAAYAKAGAEAIMFLPSPPNDRLAGLAESIGARLMMAVFDTPRERVAEWKITIVIQNRIQGIAQAAVYEAMQEFKSTGTWTKAGRGGKILEVIPQDVRDRLRRAPEFAAAAKKYQPG